MLRVYAAITIALLCSCRTTDGNNKNDISGIATSADITTAFEIIGGDRQLGKCKTSSTLDSTSESQKFIDYKFSIAGEEGGTPYQLSMKFSNHESNRSKVDVIYGFWGIAAAKSIVMERVDIISTFPANKYRFIYEVNDNKATQLELVVMNGANWNVTKKISCLN